MTAKERIGWFLALQQIIKLSKGRVAPTLPALKRQPKPSEGETSGSTPVILRQSMSFVHHAKLSSPMQTAILYRKDNLLTQYPNDGGIKFASSTPIRLAREGQATNNTQQSTAKVDRQLLVMHTFRHDLRPGQVRIEHLKDAPRLPSVRMMGSANFTKKSFAPGQAHPPLPLYTNDESRGTTPSAIHQQIKSLSHSHGTHLDERDLEGPFPNNSNAVRPVQEKETAIDQDASPSHSNASASTLHLDGMSLGRWAVQHLERVLSKPPSGITGVDPRATVPRSRVAPF